MKFLPVLFFTLIMAQSSQLISWEIPKFSDKAVKPYVTRKRALLLTSVATLSLLCCYFLMKKHKKGSTAEDSSSNSQASSPSNSESANTSGIRSSYTKGARAKARSEKENSDRALAQMARDEEQRKSQEKKDKSIQAGIEARRQKRLNS
jgi:hypothetical protein